ncbi:MAG: hypothetical protein LBC55_00425 [Desulfovibrio sp.]|jgi:hypothetical protein|nr:hypothetical protein [Desulfovibrio sp.]
MEISIKLLTQEAKELFECIKIFDNLHCIMDNLQRIPHENKEKIEQLYLFVNTVFIDYHNFVASMIQPVIKACEEGAQAQNVSLFAETEAGEEFRINPGSKNITSNLVRCCKISDIFFYYRAVVYFPEKNFEELTRHFNTIFYAQIGMIHVVWRDMGKILSLLK